jgi:hypothetical protein
MFVVRNVQCLNRQSKANMMPAMITRWERLVIYACDLMVLVVKWVVDNIVNARVRYFLSWLKYLANFGHIVLLLSVRVRFRPRGNW